MEFYRQGDIAFERLDKTPKGLKNKGNILEIRGEKEGHVHRISQVQVLVPPEQEEPLPAIIVVKEKAEVTHPEHPILSLPQGKYRVTQFREYQSQRPVD